MKRSALGVWRWVVVGVVLFVGAMTARGVDGVVVGSSPVGDARIGLDRADAHAWIVVDGEASLLRNSRSWIIVQVPPRRAAHEDGIVRGAGEGTVRQILPAIQEKPVALAAWGDELYVISEADTIFPQAQRQVGSVRVVATGVGDYWAAQPTHRLQPRPALKGGGEILGATGTSAGPMVLVAKEGAAGTPPGLLLRVLRGGAWRELVLPDEVRRTVEREGKLPTNDPRGGRWWRLVATRAGVEIWSGVAGGDGARMWSVARVGDAVERALTASPPSSEAEPRATGEEVGMGVRERRRQERERRAHEAERSESVSVARVEWTAADVKLPGGWASFVVPPRVIEIDGRRVLIAWRSAGEAVVHSEVGGAWRELWRGAVPSHAGVFATAGSGRVVFAWSTGLFNSPGYGLQLVEVSACSGREMYAGAAASVSPVTSTDLRFIAIFLLGASAAVLLFVLKSEAADKAFHLPEGTALAEGWRRGLASMIDLFVALVIAAEVRGVDLGESMSLSGWMTGQGLPVLLLALGIACVTCTILESMAGRSLGKMLAGCEVVDVSGRGEASNAGDEAGGLARPTLVRSAIRNLIKWAFPPVGMFMALDASGRHPGDVFGRTAVVCWLPPEEDESEM